MKKKLARILAFAISAVMLATQLPYALAADTDYCSVCGEDGVRGDLQHTIAHTCGKDGFEIYACSNGDCEGTITVKVSATQTHTPDGNTVEEVPATCTETGTRAYQLCTGCGCYLVPGTSNELDIVIPATGHSYTDVVTPPNCTAEGYTTHTCSVCGDSYVDTKVAALGHDFSVTVPAKSATCKEEGYTEYKVCSRCGAEDPNHPKVVIPVQDHSLRLIDHADPTCTTDGYNEFKCDELTCPYYLGITEVISKTGHSLVHHDAKTATCEEKGYGAYDTCTKCDYSTYDISTEVPALGHTYVSKGYIDPTCTEEGCTDAIVCDRCGYIHHQGESIEALGHTLEDVPAVSATCFVNGNIAHKKCTVCEKLFATTVENGDIDAVPLSSVVTTREHKYTDITIDSTCTEGGYKVYTCTQTGCTHTYSEPIAAKGHTLVDVAEVPATCANGGATGTKAHKKCSDCNKLFATTATGKVDDVEITAASLVIDAPDHSPIDVEALNPTYNAAGHIAGTKCENCDESIIGATQLDELKEAVKFHYELVGVNGAANAVNSGYVTLKIYFDVLKDATNDLDIYNSDVLANIFGVDFAMNYNKDVFELTNVLVAPGAFDNAAFTPLATANDVGTIAIAQDMNKVEGKVFRGKNNLFATLTFQVDKDAAKGNYGFDLANILVVHPEIDEATVDASASDSSVAIDVKALGDANGDTMFNSADSLKVATYIKTADEDTEYVAEYDMNKDGVIDYKDLDLLRKAIVGNTEYLKITVDPNAITPEV